MKKGLDIDVAIAIPARALKCALAVALLGGLATELASENVTMATFYPAPSGVYTQMMTMNSAILATNGGSPSGGVAIGTSFQPASGLVVMNNGAAVSMGVNTASPGDALEVDGTASFTSGVTLENSSGGSAAFLNGGVLTSPGALIVQSGSGHAGLVIKGGNVGIGTPSPQAALDVNGDISFFGSCNSVQFSTGTATCGAGEYATWIAGVEAEKQDGTIQNQDGSGRMLCCACKNGDCCPGGTCPF